MRKVMYLVLGTLLAAGATAGVGCGDSDSNSGGSGPGGGSAGSPATGGSTPGTGGTTSSPGTGGSTTSSPSTGGSGGTGGSTALSCDAYCDATLANCTTGDSDSQYPDLGADGQHPRDICMATCASFVVGSQSDTSGDTLGCRTYHANNTPHTTHCWHAGLVGGDSNNGDPDEGVCGDACEAFCNLEAVACTGANKQYDSKAACTTACRAFPAPAAPAVYDAVDAATRHDFFCYAYHLTAASVDPVTHCQHTKHGTSPCDPQ